MSFSRKARPLVALVAAYAVALQTALLAIGGAIAGVGGLGGQPICSHATTGDPRPLPPGHGYDCLASCAACCCGVSALPAPSGPVRSARTPGRAIAVLNEAAPVTGLSVARAHRSRGPPTTEA